MPTAANNPDSRSVCCPERSEASTSPPRRAPATPRMHACVRPEPAVVKQPATSPIRNRSATRGRHNAPGPNATILSHAPPIRCLPPGRQLGRTGSSRPLDATWRKPRHVPLPELAACVCPQQEKRKRRRRILLLLNAGPRRRSPMRHVCPEMPRSLATPQTCRSLACVVRKAQRTTQRAAPASCEQQRNLKRKRE